MQDLIVSLIQTPLYWEDPVGNRAMLEEKIAGIDKTDVIVLPEQNMLYPEEQKQWIIHELKEAEKKVEILMKKVPNPSSREDFRIEDLDAND